MVKPEHRRRLMWRVGRKLYTRARNEILVNSIATNGETYVQRCVLNGAKSPLVVFDVGANLGEWTRHLLEQMPVRARSGSRVFLFEPIESTRMKLQQNLERVKHSELTSVLPLAMSDAEGEAEMVVMTSTGGTNSLSFDEDLMAQALDRTTITKATLDGFCEAEGVDRIHLLKCDTEGHDAHALAGARGLLAAGRIDVAQFEYNHRWIYARSYLKDVFELVRDLPYRVGRVCPGHIELFDAWHFELERFFESNYVLLHEDAQGWFDVHAGTFDPANTWVRGD